MQESIRGCDVFLIQPTSPPVNDHLMELMVMIDACKRASARSITAVIPYYGYARADRKTHGREYARLRALQCFVTPCSILPLHATLALMVASAESQVDCCQADCKHPHRGWRLAGASHGPALGPMRRILRYSSGSCVR